MTTPLRPADFSRFFTAEARALPPWQVVDDLCTALEGLLAALEGFAAVPAGSRGESDRRAVMEAWDALRGAVEMCLAVQGGMSWPTAEPDCRAWIVLGAVARFARVDWSEMSDEAKDYWGPAILREVRSRLGQLAPHRIPSDSGSLEVRRRFEALAREWKAATRHLSTVRDKVEHPAYREIVGMGLAVVPLLLRELERTPGHWFPALGRITGADPVPEGCRGDIGKMSESWIDWGRANGYRW